MFPLSRGAVVVIPLAGLAVLTVSGADAKSDKSPLKCQISVSNSGDGVTLKGIVFSSQQSHGEYRLSVKKSGSGGSADINQSGEFEAGPNVPTELGVVSLGLNGGSYVAKLRISTDGETTECTERVGGSL